MAEFMLRNVAHCPKCGKRLSDGWSRYRAAFGLFWTDYAYLCPHCKRKFTEPENRDIVNERELTRAIDVLDNRTDSTALCLSTLHKRIAALEAKPKARKRG